MNVPRAVLTTMAPLLAAAASAQVANEFDFDTTQLTVTTLPPGSGTLFVSSPITYTGQNLRLVANLVVQDGGELVLDRSQLVVRGDITIRRGGRISVLDSSLLISSDFTGQFTLWNEGGLLHTERAVLGGAPSASIHGVRFLHLRGTWLARHTSMQLMGVVIANGPQGWFGNPAHRGGSIFADGLYEGDYADAIHMCGVGDAVLANGTMNVGLYLDAAAAGVPTTAIVDLQNAVPLDAVYGDPAVHEGVTHPVLGALYRLQLAQHRSAGWQFFATNVTQSGPLFTLTLRNIRDAIFGVTCDNLAGTPILAGPWSSHYADMPGLPSIHRPGHHAIPPACSVQLGNVVFRSDVNEWSRVLSWGLYFTGANTNFSVIGPSTIAEVMVRGGQVHLRGSKSFDMGFQAGVAEVSNGAALTVENAAVGAHVPGFVGLVEVADGSSCTITQGRASPVRLRATAPTASISVQNLINLGDLIVEPGAGNVQLSQASSSQNWDLQNLSMDVPGASVPYWGASGFTSTLVTDGAPGAPGNTSRELVSGAAGGSIRKILSLPPETYVTVIASTKLLQVGGSVPEVRVSQGGNVSTAPLGPASGAWRRTHVPILTVNGTAPTVVELVCPGSATLRVDDVRVRVNSWWDNDNLANLDFEGGYRHLSPFQPSSRAPDAWTSGLAMCDADTGTVRPGAPAGSRSVRATIAPEYGFIYKDLSFCRPGDQVVVSGWMRGLAAGPGTGMAAQVGDGPTWSLPIGNNQQVIHPTDGVWRQFTLTYTVPPNVTFTRVSLSCWNQSGAQCWFDDLSVRIQ
jgi:hypothetical protein